jgi:hypothetical protein
MSKYRAERTASAAIAPSRLKLRFDRVDDFSWDFPFGDPLTTLPSASRPIKPIRVRAARAMEDAEAAKRASGRLEPQRA